MERSERAVFGWSLLATLFLVLVLGSVVLPPDPITMASYHAVAVPVALVVSYVLAYRNGYAVLRAWFESGTG